MGHTALEIDLGEVPIALAWVHIWPKKVQFKPTLGVLYSFFFLDRIEYYTQRQ
jgi:hypothetical protein